MHSAQDVLIRYPVSEIYLKHLSVEPHLQSVYFLSHLLVLYPTLTLVTSYREHIAVENPQPRAQTDAPSHHPLPAKTQPEPFSPLLPHPAHTPHPPTSNNSNI